MKVGIMGAGNFGTAISQIISQNVEEVILYSRREEVAKTIREHNYNLDYFPNTKLNKNIHATSQLDDLKDCNIILISVPSSVFRQTLEEMKNKNINDFILITASKGIESSLKTMGEIIQEYYDENYVVLSGPNFASEIILNLPTATSIASRNEENLKIVKEVLETKEFKVEIIEDIDGIEYCGIIKNINAIAYGICEGMNINENARFAILNKGFNESKEFISKIGGKKSTLDNLCGFGDFVLTSISQESRNHTLGMLYGQKLIIDEKSSGVVFEGKNSIMAIKKIHDNYSMNSAIVDFVYDVVVNQKSPKLAFNDLWSEICK
ncbi:NAD(P)H-dependent glycerol-3-phosphate dehydrogenase [Methanobrevibacter filiformis]|uniref:Glycerol-3-phosphate dehydrogenase [NAD(P)+] n=1 Tax=Methanobrevibacter filiformis TaxID=55758 RepID=A0A166CWP7_9EURY|nr:NAD(P)H-dependent glycerol-3-phosphate dehydrogenase [Methanobrevibacter filiformis]KZX17307.1 glycerol-3-phosphate dehydrogenase [Methanobrevibacter filiformis]